MSCLSEGTWKNSRLYGRRLGDLVPAAAVYICNRAAVVIGKNVRAFGAWRVVRWKEGETVMRKMVIRARNQSKRQFCFRVPCGPYTIDDKV